MIRFIYLFYIFDQTIGESIKTRGLKKPEGGLNPPNPDKSSTDLGFLG